MNVQEFIDELKKIKDQSKRVTIVSYSHKYKMNCHREAKIIELIPDILIVEDE